MVSGSGSGSAEHTQDADPGTLAPDAPLPHARATPTATAAVPITHETGPTGPTGPTGTAACPAATAAPAAEVPVVDPQRYDLTGELARGGLGRVLEAFDRRLGRVIAVKELIDHRRGDQDRFVREALLTARLEHPAIVPVHDFGRWPSGEPFYAMKLVSGRSFAEVITASRSLDERLALLPHVIAVADAIAYAHSHRIIHRDLKPSNVMLGPFGETVVIDWGLAKDLTAAADAEELAPESHDSLVGAELTRAGAVLGTPAYMPPEQARGDTVDERADVYALGVILHELLAGAPPYQAASSGEVLAQVLAGAPSPVERQQPGIPPDLAAIVHKAMDRDPARRYPSARELAEDLRRFQTGRLVSAHHYSRAALLGRWLRRYRLPVAIAALALVALATTGVLGTRRIIAERNRAEARSHELLLAQARAALERDPTEALAWLRTYPPEAPGWDEVRALAIEAESLGVARHVLGPEGFGAFTEGGRTWVSLVDSQVLELRELASGRSVRRLPLPRAVADLAASPDGAHIALSAADGTALWLLDLATGEPRPLAGHLGPVRALAFSGDGRWLASGGVDGTIHLWPTGAGAPRRVGRPGVPVIALEISRDGRWLLSWSAGQSTAELWETSGSGRRAIGGGGAPIAASALAPDGSHVAFVTQDGGVWLETCAGEGRRRLGEHGGRLNALRFSPDGAYLVSAGESGNVMLWSVRDALHRSLAPRHTSGVHRAEFSPDGRLLVSVSHDGELRRWELPSGTGRSLGRDLGRPTRLTFTSDGRYLGSATRRYAARIWELTSDASRVLGQHALDVYQVIFSQDGRLVATASRDLGLGWWDLASGRSGLLRGHLNSPSTLAFAPGRPLLASGGHDATVRLWDLGPCLAVADGGRGGADCSPRVEVLDAHQGTVWKLAFTPDGRLLLSSGGDSGLRLWDAQGHLVRTLDSPGGIGLAIAPDGRHAASGGVDGAVRLWELPGGSMRRLGAHEGPVRALAFSPDGQRLVSVGKDLAVRLWDLARADAPPRLLGRHEAPLTDVAFAPDGRLVASAAEDGSVRLWDLGSGTVRALEGHRDRVYQLAFTPDGSLLGSASQDHTVRLWEVPNGALAHVYWHQSEVYTLAFAPDGRWLASAGADGAVHLAPVERSTAPAQPQALLEWIEGRSTAVLGPRHQILTPRSTGPHGP